MYGDVNRINITIKYSAEYALSRAVWKQHFCLWPRRCISTQQLLWFTMCYQGLRIITGPGEPVEEVYYMHQDEFILWKLKQ